ncbi:DNA-binding protein [Microbacterium xanthum]|uniref:DNA-binding protein n=1 Tax=Microbacterium xanthum TaxID=3079794 RepID=UPI002AD3F2BC|nr:MULTISPECIES: DNA-binding protein [unclassified Microbacterium]MDZ8171356.1 DNA-binding protein [Microbacterium sp. KSW-48]MDZ8201851.1 DNA-binding protein [Microbacterium sp. SSW1-59]
MFVITSDQRNSRDGDDLVPPALDLLDRLGEDRWAARPERTAGDEIQMATADPALALATLLTLTRTGDWSVGVGAGPVERPLPSSVRAGRGIAFVAAREAVERAKSASSRCTVVGGSGGHDADALVALLIDLRDRRSPEGWEVFDLLAEGMTQREAAERLGISAGAVSLRAKAAGLRLEEAATPALVHVLEHAADSPDDVDGP